MLKLHKQGLKEKPDRNPAPFFYPISYEKPRTK